jgi:Icc-related predicted phosphoesterase
MSTRPLKILVVSDEVLPSIYSQQIVENHGDVDFVIGCGDLPFYYLEYITTMLRKPVAYVYGNHDNPVSMSDGRVARAPEGCIKLEGRSRELEGLLIVGFGGSMRYQPRAEHQYTEADMRGRVISLIPTLIYNRIVHGRFMDIFVAHSPPYGIHDGEDLPHRGFKVFLWLMRVFKPRYMIHGHKHIYRRDTVRVTSYHETTVVNVYPSRILIWPPESAPEGFFDHSDS